MKSEESGDSKIHGTFCGVGIPPLITSASNKMRVVFKTDSTVQKTGFAAKFITGLFFVALLEFFFYLSKDLMVQFFKFLVCFYRRNDLRLCRKHKENP